VRLSVERVGVFLSVERGVCLTGRLISCPVRWSSSSSRTSEATLPSHPPKWAQWTWLLSQPTVMTRPSARVFATAHRSTNPHSIVCGPSFLHEPNAWSVSVNWAGQFCQLSKANAHMSKTIFSVEGV
jgi:hypothetical protein